MATVLLSTRPTALRPGWRHLPVLLLSAAMAIGAIALNGAEATAVLAVALALCGGLLAVVAAEHAADRLLGDPALDALALSPLPPVLRLWQLSGPLAPWCWAFALGAALVALPLARPMTVLAMLACLATAQALAVLVPVALHRSWGRIPPLLEVLLPLPAMAVAGCALGLLAQSAEPFRFFYSQTLNLFAREGAALAAAAIASTAAAWTLRRPSAGGAEMLRRLGMEALAITAVLLVLWTRPLALWTDLGGSPDMPRLWPLLLVLAILPHVLAFGVPQPATPRAEAGPAWQRWMPAPGLVTVAGLVLGFAIAVPAALWTTLTWLAMALEVVADLLLIQWLRKHRPADVAAMLALGLVALRQLEWLVLERAVTGGGGAVWLGVAVVELIAALAWVMTMPRAQAQFVLEPEARSPGRWRHRAALPLHPLADALLVAALVLASIRIVVQDQFLLLNGFEPRGGVTLTVGIAVVAAAVLRLVGRQRLDLLQHERLQLAPMPLWRRIGTLLWPALLPGLAGVLAFALGMAVTLMQEPVPEVPFPTYYPTPAEPAPIFASIAIYGLPTLGLAAALALSFGLLLLRAGSGLGLGWRLFALTVTVQIAALAAMASYAGEMPQAFALCCALALLLPLMALQLQLHRRAGLVWILMALAVPLWPPAIGALVWSVDDSRFAVEALDPRIALSLGTVLALAAAFLAPPPSAPGRDLRGVAVRRCTPLRSGLIPALLALAVAAALAPVLAEVQTALQAGTMAYSGMVPFSGAAEAIATMPLWAMAALRDVLLVIGLRFWHRPGWALVAVAMLAVPGIVPVFMGFYGMPLGAVVLAPFASVGVAAYDPAQAATAGMGAWPLLTAELAVAAGFVVTSLLLYGRELPRLRKARPRRPPPLPAREAALS